MIFITDELGKFEKNIIELKVVTYFDTKCTPLG